jgi:Fic family protein
MWVDLDKNKGGMLSLDISEEILGTVSRLDRFQGSWSAGLGIPPDRLRRIEAAARIQSVGASSRLAGIRVSDSEVASLLEGGTPPLGDGPEILGYAAAMTHPLTSADGILTSEAIRSLHARMMGRDVAEPSPWRTQPLHREAFDRDGRATGRVFSALPPRMVEEKTEELLTWFELEMREAERHPMLVVGGFLLLLLAISPFARGNARLTRLLAGRLLERAGYSFLPYASLEREFEMLRDRFYDAYDVSQTHLWSERANPRPWLEFFAEVVDRHRQRVEVKARLERDVIDFAPLQRAILETVREHGTVDAKLLVQATGANRNTLKDNLRRLVQSGVLEKTGQRRGTRYRMGRGQTHEV